jgi:phage terminase large subunit-like protein
MEWMKDVIREIYDPLDADGNRLINMVYIEIPRKNSKTTLLAGLAMYHLIADGEYGPEVVVAAADRGQSSIMQDISKQMVRQNQKLQAHTIIRQFEILSSDRKGYMKAISSDAHTKHGLNLSFCALDELHTWKQRDLYDVLLTSQVSRKNPLAIAITTAGSDKGSLCYEVHDYAMKVISGAIVDPHFKGFIYSADEKDPWDAEATWKKANPGYGLSVNKAYLERKVIEARNNPSLIPVFKQLHLNIWTSDYTSWFPSHIFDQNTTPEPDLSTKIAYGGLDVASTSDFTSFALIFDMGDGTFYLKNWYWLPGEMAQTRMKKNPALATWTHQGWIKRTEGNVMDDRSIAEDMIEICRGYRVASVSYDKALAHSGVAQDLMRAGVDMHPMSQGIMTMSEPTKSYEKMHRQVRLHNDGNPVTRWMLENVVLYRDANDNYKLIKNRSTEKIDGVVAGVMAVAQMLFVESENPTSIYAINDM